ncbi:MULTISPECIES: hypothetical protein [Microbacterium]|uniref:DUF5667 domain-containing protein n=2 Tax=Microbacterium TaxID=33882 RepID=A0ABX5ST63_9MICO|nr:MULTISPECIES: hypothetical protein [Microbacterium]MCK6064887.1 hypothetical protein [Microbacterium sp. EYE_512]QBR88372.1 hypothetical protein E4K62_06520 [Microbacterium wangchenii]TXK20098.1 hypothetical protein FVP99_00135 [Microbacterium wangchenii]
MEQMTLDDLLARSGSLTEQSTRVDALAAEMAREITTEVRRPWWRPRSAVATVTLAGVLIVGAGAAVAVPLLNDWWMWVPSDDLSFRSEPIAVDGAVVTCETQLRALADGKTAGDDSIERLQAARAWLRSVDLASFADEAREIREIGGVGNGPPELADSMALAIAIGLEMQERGLTGGGVKLDSSTNCPPEVFDE